MVYVFGFRHTLLHQRTLHHELFTPVLQGVEWESEKKKFNLYDIEFLTGCTSKLNDLVVLGMITQLKEGKYYLEDPTGAVQIDLSLCKYHTGLFTENCFVLAEGFYDDGIFNVMAIGLPPPEEASVTRYLLLYIYLFDYIMFQIHVSTYKYEVKLYERTNQQ